MPSIKVIVVDDSALIRQLLSEILSSDPAIEVVATAADPYQARDKIKQYNPDVLTLDVEMPKMDGISFLKKLMRLRPMPVVMVSTLTAQGAQISLDALALGAVDVVAKPKLDLVRSMTDYAQEIISKVKAASQVQVKPLMSDESAVPPRLSADAVLFKSTTLPRLLTTDKVVAIGASTGGTEAIRQVLAAMPANAPGMVITQHIPISFSGAFAERVNKLSAMQVAEARDGQQILPGHAYIAPGDQHLLVERSGARYLCRLNAGPPVNRHKPSVDVLFRSVAQQVGPNAVGVILTGMGDDGAQGLLEMRQAGAATLAQDEASSVVWGMPGSAVRLDAAQQQAALTDIAVSILRLSFAAQ